MDIQGFFQRWGWFLLLGAGAFVGAYLLFGRKAKATTPSSLPGVAGQPGANGQPVVEYVPTTGDQYTNINYQQDSGNVTNTNSGNTTSSSTSTVTVPPPPFRPPIVPITPGGPPVPPPPGPRPPVPPIHPTPPPGPLTVPYTIKYGDTLSAIAARYHTTWQILYNANKSTIDSWAAKHHNPIPGGPWNNIFPAETIQVPR